MSKVEGSRSVDTQVDVLHLSGYVAEGKVAHDSLTADFETVVIADCLVERLGGPRELYVYTEQEN